MDIQRGHKDTRTLRITKFELNLLGETWSLRDLVALFVSVRCTFGCIKPQSGEILKKHHLSIVCDDKYVISN